MPGLQQSREREGCRVAVLVGEQKLHVAVATPCHLGSVLGQLVERADGPEPDRRLWRREEDLQYGDSVSNVVLHVVRPGDDSAALVSFVRRSELTECTRCLVGHHVALVAQATVQVCHQRFVDRGVQICHEGLRRIADQKAVRHGALTRALCQAGHDLVESQAICLLQLVHQDQCVKLHHAVLRTHCLLDLIDPSPDHIRNALDQVETANKGRGSDKRILVDDSGLQVPVDLCCHGRIEDAAQDPNGVRPEGIILAIHVLDETRHADEDLSLRWLQLLDHEVDHAP
mmetsp:Transcript_68621/g.146920  ORF Transcript_68621/g.146920 Transcript_68621/m.146920 type:complete len:286 (+) Transcript_68621:1714-2571(+)